MVSTCGFHTHPLHVIMLLTQRSAFSWEFFTTLDYEWSVIRGHRPYRWSIWVCGARHSSWISLPAQKPQTGAPSLLDLLRYTCRHSRSCDP